MILKVGFEMILNVGLNMAMNVGLNITTNLGSDFFECPAFPVSLFLTEFVDCVRSKISKFPQTFWNVLLSSKFSNV